MTARPRRWLAAALVLEVASTSLVFAQSGPAIDDSLRTRTDRLTSRLEPLLAAFEARTFVASNDTTVPYRLYAPQSGVDGKQYPLVLFLHGGNGRGEDNVQQMSGGNIWGARIWALPENQKTHPCFVVVPQGTGWWKRRLPMVMELLDQLHPELGFDRNRVYVTGQSMGGYGTWDALTDYPETFAAGVPLAGGGEPDKAVNIVEHEIGVWAFHGGRDDKADRSRAMITALEKAGGAPRFTEYPDAGHDIWMRAYTEKQLLPWLFSHRR